MNPMKAFLLTIGAFLLAAAAGVSLPVQGAPPQATAAGASDDTARGQAIFGDRCAICHYDQSAAQKMGPGLKGIYARGKFADGKKVDDAGMTAWVEKGGKDMPGLKDTLKPEEIRALISYLKTI
jgi:cytochrome c